MCRPINTLTRLLLFAVLSTGCGDGSARSLEDAEGRGPEIVQAVVDSILPIDEEIRRFKLTTKREATKLTDGASTREELVRTFVAALEQSDTAALARAVIDRSEFIDLYYPHTVYTAPPYELSPGIVWFQMMNNSSRGITRAYRRFAGKPLNYRSHSCRADPEREGPNRIWDCRVVRIAMDGVEIELRLFGLIIERGGLFKFITYANEL